MADDQDTRELTQKQELFCEEYSIDLNGTQAAIRAGYSTKTAQMQASRLLSNALVQERIQHILDKRSKKLHINAETILRELYDLATVDITQAYDEAGWLKPISEIPKEVRKAIAGLEVNELYDGQGDEKHIIGVNKKIKFYDRTKTLELLGKHLKLFTDRHEHSGPDGKPIEHKNVSDLTDDQLDEKIKSYFKKEDTADGNG